MAMANYYKRALGEPRKERIKPAPEPVPEAGTPLVVLGESRDAPEPVTTFDVEKAPEVEEDPIVEGKSKKGKKK